MNSWKELIQQKQIMEEKIKYYIIGDRPVYFTLKPDGSVTEPYALNWQTREFEYDYDCWTRIIFGKADELEELTKEKFAEYVEKLKQKNN